VRAWKETAADNISLLAAGVAFYSFLAFVPMLASVVLVYGIVADPADVAGHLDALTRILPADAAAIVADQLKGMTETPVERTAAGLVVAILLAIYGAMRGATSVIGALNVTYDERETRNFLRTTGLSFAFTLGAVAVAIVALLAISAMTLIGTVVQLPAATAPLVTGGLWVVTAAVASGLVAVVYRYGPDREDARWTWLTPGAVFASVGALLATFLFGYYVSHFAGYNATYGALGAVVSFLMWLYVTAFVVLLGAELNAEIERQTAEDTTSGPDKAMGDRGAAMADVVAGGPSDTAGEPPASGGSAASRGAGRSGHPPLSAARRAGGLGNVRIGVMPMALIVAGARLLGRHGRSGRALAFLAMAGALALHEHARDGKKKDATGMKQL